jgi:nicotinate-nucleotide adenylyltransferase
MVFGGTFDPPHYYHTVGPLVALNRVIPERSWLLYVPAARNPLKPGSPCASDEHRLAMLKLSLDVPAPRSIWTDEIDRARRQRGAARRGSFTIDTLRRLRRELDGQGRSDVTLHLLIGADQAVGFHRWKEPRGILRLATPVVMPRVAVVPQGRGTSGESALIERPRELYAAMQQTNYWTRAELAAWGSRLAPIFPMDPSSTDIRAKIPGAPADPERWRQHPGLDWVTTSVARFIIDHNLYGFRPGPAKPVTPEEEIAQPLGDRPGQMDRLIATMSTTLAEVIARDAVASGPRRGARGAVRSRRRRSTSRPS